MRENKKYRTAELRYKRQAMIGVMRKAGWV